MTTHTQYDRHLACHIPQIKENQKIHGEELKASRGSSYCNAGSSAELMNRGAADRRSLRNTAAITNISRLELFRK
jgi:hypothetical protein